VKRVFDALPLTQAMHELVPQGSQTGLMSLTGQEAAGFTTELQAGICLYVDDLDRSHTMSQGLPGPVGAYWHGTMHRREGDFSNAKYWLRQTVEIKLDIPGYDACEFVDQVEAARGANPADLLAMQRAEWIALFNYCVELAKE
jgi:hypothetical protein